MTKNLKSIFFNPAILLVLIILAQSALILYYAGHKKNFYMDEVATLLTANDSNMPQNGYLEVGRIYSVNDLKSAITIGAGERFNFEFVKKNLLKDLLHTPLYFFTFHAAYSVYSFFSDGFSIYPGILLNLAFFILTSVLLYGISRFIFGKYSALLVNCLWGLSTAAINSVLIIRPYALLACIFALLTYSVFSSARAKNLNISNCLLLWLAVFCGILTHYHFFIFAALVLFIFFVFLAIARRYKDLFKAAATAAASFLAAALCYRPIMQVIFSLAADNSVADRKISLFNKLFVNAYTSLSLWLTQTFGGTVWNIIFYAGIILILFWAVKVLIKKQPVKINFFIAVCCTSVLFIVITWQSLSFRNWHDSRYLWPVYPVAAVFFMFLLDSAVNLFFSKNAKKKIIFAGIAIILTALPFFEKRPLVWLYTDTPNFSRYRDSLAIGINDSNDGYALLRFSGFIYDLTQVKNFVILGKNPGEELDEILKKGEYRREQILLLLHFLASAPARNSVLSVLEKYGYSVTTDFITEKSEIAVFSSSKETKTQ